MASPDVVGSWLCCIPQDRIAAVIKAEEEKSLGFMGRGKKCVAWVWCLGFI
jgi:hypothetical protein